MVSKNGRKSRLRNAAFDRIMQGVVGKMVENQSKIDPKMVVNQGSWDQKMVENQGCWACRYLLTKPSVLGKLFLLFNMEESREK